MKDISDEQLKAYFLGTLPEPEAESLEIECASSTELSEQAQDVERELTDDYLRGNLSAADIRLYETNYLITEARRQKFQVAAQLWKIVKETAPSPVYPVASSASPSPFWQTLFGKRRVFELAFGGLFLLFVCGAVAFYLLNSSVSKTEITEVKDPAQSSKPEYPAVQSPDNQTIETRRRKTKIRKPLRRTRAFKIKKSKEKFSHPRKISPK
jgi:hypothetical protein